MLAGRRLVVDIDVVHSSRRRTIATPLDESFDRLGWSLGDEFDGAVLTIADPSTYAELIRSLLAAGAKGDTLHPTGHDDPAADVSGS